VAIRAQVFLDIVATVVPLVLQVLLGIRATLENQAIADTVVVLELPATVDTRVSPVILVPLVTQDTQVP